VKLIRLALLHAVCAGPNLLTALILTFIRLAWGKKTHWVKGVCIVELDAKKWLARGPYKKWGGTTFGPHGFMINDGSMHVADHELIHTEQMQAEALQNSIITGVVFALSGFSWMTLAFAIWWALGPLTALVAGNLTAVLRGETFYLGSHFEEAAYALDDKDHDHG
jgi:hypothetical protein